MSRHAIPRGGFLFHERNAHHSLKSREIYTVRYDAVNAMLLNEFLKEHRKVDAQSREILEQRATITELKKEMQTVVARLKDQDSKIQRVSNQIDLSKVAPQIALNNP
jgi:septal ring factor EnvC (AmiA/AmiB activator)